MAALVVIGTLSGCAGLRAEPPQDGTDDYALLESKSAFNSEKSEWSTPFWERWTKPSSSGQGAPKTIPNNPNTDAATRVAVANSPTSTRAAVPAPAAAAATAASAKPAAGASLRPQIGIYLDAESRESKAAYQLVEALNRQAPAYGMTVIKPDALTDALGDESTCTEPTSIRCRQTLAIYPGVRALLIIDVQSSGANGQARVATRMADTDFGVDYNASTANVSLQDSGLSLWSQQVLDRTAGRLAIAPWFTHSFARQGDSVYISAGPRSGLTPGTTLAMHGEGSIVRAPGGSVVGWSPGPVVGRLKVKSPVGEGASVAELISGQMPQPGDRLTVATQENDTTGR